MLAVKGIYKHGRIFLKEEVKTTKPVNVIVTFLEDFETAVSKKIDLKNFSLNKSKELLKDYKGSLSDAVLEERRNAV